MALNFGRSLFPERPQNLFNYDYIDILTGQGYITFYIVRAETDNVEVNLLTPIQVICRENDKSISVSDSSPDGTKTEIFNTDYDYKVRVASNLAIGTGYIEVNQRHGGSGTGKFHFVQVKLRKFDGSTETEIANGETRISSGSGGTDTRRELATLDITSQVHFNPGDILRATVILSVTANNASGSVSTGYHVEPFSRNKLKVQIASADGETSFSGEPTSFKVILPFKLNL